jgi:hypothetical protein
MGNRVPLDKLATVELYVRTFQKASYETLKIDINSTAIDTNDVIRNYALKISKDEKLKHDFDVLIRDYTDNTDTIPRRITDLENSKKKVPIRWVRSLSRQLKLSCHKDTVSYQ